tara:strand:+ start:23397 stop:24035 length:639 start_codon:yes stop_codon:yes gene_type:complete
MSEYDSFIEVPFGNRHQCWFCAEPAASHFTFPHQEHLIFDCPHQKLTVPSCSECSDAALKAKVRNIWQVEQHVKKYLMKKYKKDLAIGLNWTREELANSGFEGGSFSGFQKSAWFMYEVAKGRVNFCGWPLVLDGIEIEKDNISDSFTFDGVAYPSIEEAIESYSENFRLDAMFLRQILAKIGQEKFAQAVRVCRLYIAATLAEKSRALRDF